MHCGCTTIPTALCGGSYPPITSYNNNPSSQQDEQLRLAAQKYALIRKAELKAEIELAQVKSQCTALQAALRERLDEASEIAVQTQYQNAADSTYIKRVDDAAENDDEHISQVDEVCALAANILTIRTNIVSFRLEADKSNASSNVLHKSIEEHSAVKAKLMAKKNHLTSHGVAERDALHKDALARGKTSDRINQLKVELAALDDRLHIQHTSNALLAGRVAELEESGKRHRVRILSNKAQAAALRDKKSKLKKTLEEVVVEKSGISAKRDDAAAKRPSPQPSTSSSPHLGLLKDVLASVQALRRQYEEGTIPATALAPQLL